MKNKITNFGIGMTSIMMVFVIVCLTFLALLAYVVTEKDANITRKKEEYSYSYKQADNKAVYKLASIDEELYNLAIEKKQLDSKDAKQRLNSIEDIEVDYKSKCIDYNMHVDNRAYIKVKLNVCTDRNGVISKKDRYKIIKWQLVNEAEVIEEEPLNIWGAEE